PIPGQARPAGSFRQSGLAPALAPWRTPDCARLFHATYIEGDQLPGPCAVRFLPREPLTGLERRCLERGRVGDLLRHGHPVADLQMLVFGRDAVGAGEPALSSR